VETRRDLTVKIAFVAPLVTAIREPQLGGSQALLADIAAGLTHRGLDVTVFAASGSQIDGVRTIDTGIDPSVLRATFFRASEDVSGFDISRDAFAHVWGLVRGHGSDLVHNHAFDAPAIELGSIDVPVVHTVHLPPTPSVVAALEHHPQATVACVSEHSATLWRKHVRVDAILRNGVPVDRIPWSSDSGNGLLYAGRFSPEKGAAESIAIALGAGCEITLVGSRYDESYTREAIDPYRTHDLVTIRDAIPRAELWELMSRSRAVLCPISWDEPFGLVAAEAQAAGTPVVAYDRGALREVIADGVTGRLVADERGAVDAVQTIGDIGRAACRQHAERTLCLDATLDAHEALYATLISTAKAAT
jgi:glycosyltransferase involved in cell wall biosynthesis